LLLEQKTSLQRHQRQHKNYFHGQNKRHLLQQKLDLEKIIANPGSPECLELSFQRIVKDRNVSWAEHVANELNLELKNDPSEVGVDSLGVERTYLMFCGREHMLSPRSFIDVLKEQHGFNESWLEYVFPKLKAFRNFFGDTVEDLIHKRLDHLKKIRQRRGSRKGSFSMHKSAEVSA